MIILRVYCVAVTVRHFDLKCERQRVACLEDAGVSAGWLNFDKDSEDLVVLCIAWQSNERSKRCLGCPLERANLIGNYS